MTENNSLKTQLEQWQTEGRAFWKQVNALVETLTNVVDNIKNLPNR